MWFCAFGCTAGALQAERVDCLQVPTPYGENRACLAQRVFVLQDMRLQVCYTKFCKDQGLNGADHALFPDPGVSPSFDLPRALTDLGKSVEVAG